MNLSKYLCRMRIWFVSKVEYYGFGREITGSQYGGFTLTSSMGMSGNSISTWIAYIWIQQV